MSSYKENDCVGCPQGCINCGRNRNYYVYECDACGKEISEDEICQFMGDELCEKCYSIIAEGDMPDEE